MLAMTTRYRTFTGVMLIVVAAMFSACGARMHRGLSETRIGPAQYKIAFTQRGPVFNQVQSRLQARAAEITLERGYRYFTARWAVEDERFVYECQDRISQKDASDGGGTVVVMKPFERTESLTITMFHKDEKPANAKYRQIYDALSIKQHFGRVADKNAEERITPRGTAATASESVSLLYIN